MGCVGEGEGGAGEGVAVGVVVVVGSVGWVWGYGGCEREGGADGCRGLL